MIVTYDFLCCSHVSENLFLPKKFLFAALFMNCIVYSFVVCHSCILFCKRCELCKGFNTMDDD